MLGFLILDHALDPNSEKSNADFFYCNSISEGVRKSKEIIPLGNPMEWVSWLSFSINSSLSEIQGQVLYGGQSGPSPPELRNAPQVFVQADFGVLSYIMGSTHASTKSATSMHQNRKQSPPALQSSKINPKLKIARVATETGCYSSQLKHHAEILIV